MDNIVILIRDWGLIYTQVSGLIDSISAERFLLVYQIPSGLTSLAALTVGFWWSSWPLVPDDGQTRMPPSTNKTKYVDYRYAYTARDYCCLRFCISHPFLLFDIKKVGQARRRMDGIDWDDIG